LKNIFYLTFNIDKSQLPTMYKNNSGFSTKFKVYIFV
jgi:hypothetical protein